MTREELENEIFISVIRDLLFFSVREPCKRSPLYDTLKIKGGSLFEIDVGLP